MPKNLFYKKKPIGTLDALGRALRLPDLSRRRLISLAQASNGYYRVAKEIPKPGGVRIVYDVREPLKTVQRAVHERIFGVAVFPDYLSGGIKGRSTHTHAQPHVNAELLVNEDISNFFPSITQDQVESLFIFGFGFAPDVGQILASILTFEGKVPQGAPTSGDIANLILFRDEPRLVRELRSLGFSYTRFVDDISLSTCRPNLNTQELASAISGIVSIVESNGFRVNRRKHTLARKNQQMTTVGHLVNRKLSVPKRYARQAWAAVVNAEKLTKESPGSPESDKALQSAQGKVTYLASARSGLAARLQERLDELT